MNCLTNPYHSEVISGLLEKRPKYFEGLKEKDSITLRDFKNISEIKSTDDAVNGLILCNRLIFECFELDQEYLTGVFQDKVQNNSGSITYISLFNTIEMDSKAFHISNADHNPQTGNRIC